MNTVTKAQRAALLEAAQRITMIDPDTGDIVGTLQSVSEALAASEGVSFHRARAAVAKAARIQRHTDHLDKAIGRRPTMPDGQDFTVYLDGAQIEKARRIGGGNVSAGVRLALNLYE